MPCGAILPTVLRGCNELRTSHIPLFPGATKTKRPGRSGRGVFSYLFYLEDLAEFCFVEPNHNCPININYGHAHLARFCKCFFASNRVSRCIFVCESNFICGEKIFCHVAEVASWRTINCYISHKSFLLSIR